MFLLILRHLLYKTCSADLSFKKKKKIWLSGNHISATVSKRSYSARHGFTDKKGVKGEFYLVMMCWRCTLTRKKHTQVLWACDLLLSGKCNSTAGLSNQYRILKKKDWVVENKTHEVTQQQETNLESRKRWHEKIKKENFKVSFLQTSIFNGEKWGDSCIQLLFGKDFFFPTKAMESGSSKTLLHISSGQVDFFVNDICVEEESFSQIFPSTSL